MKRLLLLGFALVIILVTLGCGRTSTNEGVITNQSYGGVAPTASYRTVAPMTTTAAASKGSMPVPAPGIIATTYAYDKTPIAGSAGSSSSAVSTDRMVVRTGNIQMIVGQIATSIDNITRIANDSNGYVVSSQQWKNGDRNVGSLSIRVAADNYDRVMAQIMSMAKSVTNQSTTSQDVTEQYTDLSSQIKNLQATEAQLLKIMENATKVEDVLNVQAQLTSVRGQIEQIKGRMLYLERTSATSLININMEEAVLALKLSANKVSAGSNEAISFTCQVIGGFAPYNYHWDFGDGQTSVEVAPTHSYKEAGSYTVVLTVTDDKGYTNTLNRAAYINIISSWKPGNVAQNAWHGVGTFGKGLVNFLIWFGIFSFVWVPVGVVVWYFAYYRRHKRNMR
jgi:chitodextrinase